MRYTKAHEHIVGGADGYHIVICDLFTDAVVGRGSSVGTATHYGLGVTGIEFRWGRDFPHRSRPALGLTHSPIQWVPALFSGGKAAGAWR
jgi:hypothetical protein